MSQKLLAQDDFSAASAANWILETEASPSETTVVFGNGCLDAQSTGGITLWYKTPFSNNYRIEYDVSFVLGGAEHERLSDMNCFWGARDPAHPENFFANSSARGAFSTYNPLHLYYVGYGGNYNTTTRFRKYLGTSKDIITEYTDKPHLLAKDTVYHVAIEMENHSVRYFVNGECLVDYQDPAVYSSGYFGFRTILSHVQLKNFRVLAL